MSRGGVGGGVGGANVVLQGSQNEADDSALIDTNVLLRETDNELIEQMLGKLPGSGSQLSLGPDSCESDRQALLSRCRASRFCGFSQMRDHLASMCVENDLETMSVHAAEQFVFISSVVLLCTLLHLTLITLEKLYYNCFSRARRRKQADE